MKKYIGLFFKGMGMGAANVIPGVSGGTIALITGIFEQLIHAIKSFNLKALKLLLRGDFKELFTHLNIKFLIAVFAGVAVSILSIARIFGYLLENFPIYIMAFFFGLILASVYYVGKTVHQWTPGVIVGFVVGTAIALTLSFINPAQENNSLIYLMLCGVVATCSMILPGLSGSFVLILMGNYQLVMIDAVNNLDIKILLPVVFGAGIGLVLFSNALSYLYRRFKDLTISTLTGFILGSLGLIWPWKNELHAVDQAGSLLLKDGEPLVSGYDWYLPESFNSELLIALGCMVVGIVLIGLTESIALKKKE